VSDTKKRTRPVVKIHGGKYYLCNWVIDAFPKNYQEMIYVEPFCGAGSVFFNKEPSREDTINDMDKGIVHIMWALRNETREFIGRLKRLKYTEETFNRVKKKLEKNPEDYMDYAVAEFAVRRMSRGGLKKAFAWSNRERGGKPGDVNAWETMLKLLPELAEKLQGAYVLNKPAVEVIKAFDNPNTLVYCDPPYLHSTRTATDAYDLELTEDDHIELAVALNAFKGKAAISGYYSALYRDLYDGWTCKRKRIANHSSQGKSKKQKTECLWLNY